MKKYSPVLRVYLKCQIQKNHGGTYGSLRQICSPGGERLSCKMSNLQLRREGEANVQNIANVTASCQATIHPIPAVIAQNAISRRPFMHAKFGEFSLQEYKVMLQMFKLKRNQSRTQMSRSVSAQQILECYGQSSYTNCSVLFQVTSAHDHKCNLLFYLRLGSSQTVNQKDQQIKRTVKKMLNILVYQNEIE